MPHRELKTRTGSPHGRHGIRCDLFAPTRSKQQKTDGSGCKYNIHYYFIRN